MLQNSTKSEISRAIATGLQLHQSGRFEEAETVYSGVLSRQPANFEALHLLGVLAHQMGDNVAAVDLIGKAVRVNSRNPAAYNHLGASLKALGRFEEAEKSYRTAIKLQPEFADPHYNLGNTLTALKRLQEAENSYKRALYLQPEYAEAYCNLGSLLVDLGRPEEAEKACRNAIRYRHHYAKAYYNLGNALHILERFDEAEEAYNKALLLQPAFAEAYHNLGNLLSDQKRQSEAKEAYKKSIGLNPQNAALFNSLGNLLFDAGQQEEAVICFRRAVELKPNFHSARSNLISQLQGLCLWNEIAESDVQSVRQAVLDKYSEYAEPVIPFVLLTLPSVTAAEQRECAGRWMRKELGTLMQWKSMSGFAFSDNRRGPLHIGYLSTDLNDHVIAQQMVEIFELHDRSRFKITAYSTTADDNSSLRKRVEGAFDCFTDLGNSSTKDSARQINSDRVDILVDLTAYTKNSRSALLALRPAPIQVNYLGYPGSMGVDFVDYIIADSFIIPPERFDCYSEKVMWLPDCYMPHDTRTPHPSPPSKKECGLPEDAFVFCCFNQPYKITPDIFDVWCRLLKTVPDSILWLRSFNAPAEKNLKKEASARGIDVSRLIFDSFVSREEHFARLQCADLFLDTTPYNAHATCSNALWMGLPVITCSGDTFASRVAGSHLTTMGVPELVTYSLDDYHALALLLANDRKKLLDIRKKIITNRESSPLFDSVRFTRGLEALYIKMHEERLGR